MKVIWQIPHAMAKVVNAGVKVSLNDCKINEKHRSASEGMVAWWWNIDFPAFFSSKGS